ncbi:PREDICTED: transcription factor DYT1-like [Camelina sativa]|uniref:Transcription factor DYT1-like n=1 Tax=Camelina sativa TaxID=90675 RepID=A0ABM0V0Q6_CAMSA|nr:PREDICTED: transcription factor DYT1-like [Camelina sativa]
MGGGSIFQEPVRMNRRRQVTEENKGEDESFKSPNLEAERRRRQKLHVRLMALRSHVPIVTNMTKASIVEDAITYIGELQKNVQSLSEKLFEMEEAPPEIDDEEQTDQTMIKPELETIHLKEEMKKLGIEENVQLCKIGERRFWLKIITEKKPGIFTKYMEVMRFLGFEIIDISLTTSSGAILISSSVQIHEELCDVEETKDFLLEVMRSNP